MSQGNLSRIEREGDDRIELGTAMRLAIALDMPLGELAGQAELMPPAVSDAAGSRFATVHDLDQLRATVQDLIDQLRPAAALTAATIREQPPSLARQPKKPKRSRHGSGNRTAV